MKELLEWIDRVNALRIDPKGHSRASLCLAEQLLEDEAKNFQFRVLLKATNILMDDKELTPEDGGYRVTFT